MYILLFLVAKKLTLKIYRRIISYAACLWPQAKKGNQNQISSDIFWQNQLSTAKINIFTGYFGRFPKMIIAFGKHNFMFSFFP